MAAITSSTGTFNWSNTAAWVGGVVPCKPFAITAAADSPSTPGLVRITLGSATPWATGDKVNILGVVGTMAVNGSWTVTVIDSTHADLQGSSSAGTYTSGGTAFRGDTVTMAAAAVFTIDSAAVDANGLLILGADVNTGGTDALSLPSGTTTSLTVGGAYTIRLRGGVNQVDSTWTFPAGASLIYDPPSGQQYSHKLDRKANLAFNGTSGSHCTVKTDKTRGGLACYQTTPASSPMGPFLGTASYTDFIDMGDATHFGLYTLVKSSAVGNASLTHCTFLRCSHQVDINSALWAGNFTLEDCIYSSSVGYNASGNPGSCLGLISATAPTAPGIHKVNRCSFDLVATLASIHNLKVTYCVFLGGIGSGGTSSWADNTYFNNNFVNQTTTAMVPISGDTLDCYYLTQVGNPHYLSIFVASTTQAGWVIEQQTSISSDYGDVFLSPASNTRIVNCLSLANGLCNTGTAIQQGSGVMISSPGTVTGLVIEHCTIFGNVVGAMMSSFETAASGANTLASGRANIMFWPTSNAGSALVICNPSNATDCVTLSDYNGLYNATSFSNNTINGVGSQTLLGYDAVKVTSASQVGPHDFTADPQFFDQDFRGFVKWANKVKGTANTLAAALAYIAANPAEIPNLLSWVRAGYRPTNPAYNGATYPGDALATGVDANGNPFTGTVGAMAFQSPAATASGAPLLMGF